MNKFVLYSGMCGFLLSNFVSGQELWDQFKKRVAVNKELKAKFAKKTEQQLPPVPASFVPQTMIQLKAVFGPGKTEDEYIALGIKYSSDMSAWLEEGYQNKPVDVRAITEKYGEYVAYAKRIIANEKKYWPYYVFYHSQKSGLSIIQDFLNELYSWLNLETPAEQTKLLRLLVENSKYKNVDEFLAAHRNDILNSFPYKGTNFFDHLPDVILNLLAANLSLFANAGYTNESSWYYWYVDKSINPPDLEKVFSQFFKAFGFNEAFIPPLLENLGRLNTGATMCQIFIHPDVVDQITYLCWPGGSPLVSIIPPSAKELDEMGSSLSTKVVPSLTPELLKMQKDLEKVIYDPQLKRISVNKYLSIYRTQPERIPWGPVTWMKGQNAYFINDFQARLFWKYSLLLDPEKVKIFTYPSYKGLTQAERAQKEKDYKQYMTYFVEDLIQDWLLSTNKKADGKTRIEKFFELLKSR